MKKCRSVKKLFDMNFEMNFEETLVMLLRIKKKDKSENAIF